MAVPTPNSPFAQCALEPRTGEKLMYWQKELVL